MSSYFLFLNDIREELKKEAPSASVAEISKLAGYSIKFKYYSERWGHADAKTKAKFVKLQEEAKA